MDLFWTKIMPECVSSYPWGREFSGKMSTKKFKEQVSSKIKKMSDDEFDLFLSAVVMQSSKDQMMGVALTEKIQYFRDLRK